MRRPAVDLPLPERPIRKIRVTGAADLAGELLMSRILAPNATERAMSAMPPRQERFVDIRGGNILHAVQLPLLSRSGRSLASQGVMGL